MDDDGGLGELVQMLHALARGGRYKPRSWELLRDARRAKALKRATNKQVATTRTLQAATEKLQHAASISTEVRKLLKLPCGKRGITPTRAVLLMRRSMLLAQRGKYSDRRSQANAAALISNAAEKLQAQRVGDILFGPLPAGCSRSFLVYTLQWDETSQRLKRCVKPMPGEIVPNSQGAVQVIVQSGHLARVSVLHGGCVTRESMRHIIKPMTLDELGSDFILEAILRKTCTPFLDRVKMERIAASCEAFVFVCAVDRASANASVITWMFDALLTSCRIFGGVALPHAEPCALHGVALAKGRSDAGGLTSAACSLSRLLRQGRTMNTLRESIIRRVARDLVVRRRPRPLEFASRAKEIMALFMGTDGDAVHLMRTKGDGVREKGTFLKALEAFLEAHDIGGDEELVHWCWADESSGEPGPCCQSFDESVERVTVARLSWLTGLCWGVAAETRWQHASKLLKRVFVSTVCKHSLQHALTDLRLAWGVRNQDGLEAALAAIIAAEKENFQARQRLKLVRVCKAFVNPAADVFQAIFLIAMNVVDRLYSSILGHQKVRASLMDLASPKRSLIAKAQTSLLALLSDFTETTWPFVVYARGDMFSPSLRLEARRVVVQLSVGLLDYFELRFASFPLSLLALVDDETPQPVKQTIARRFSRASLDCVTDFSRSLRALCPTASAVLLRALAILREWGLATAVAIDFSERGHAKMRVGLQSIGKAKSSTASANRMVCQELRVRHMEIGGCDPLTSPLPLPPVAAEGSQALCAHPGSDFVRFHNAKLAAIKACVAPQRALCASELAAARASISEQWQLAKSSAADLAPWSMLKRNLRSRADAPALADAAPPQFRNLWGVHADRAYVMEPTAIVDFVRDGGKGVVWRDEQLRVQAPAEERCRNHGGRARLYGCTASRKNVCRVHGADSRARAPALDALTRHLTAWANGLGAETCKRCESFLWLRSNVLAADVGARGDHLPADMIVMLADVRQRPMMQYFVVCCLPPNGPSHFEVPPFPFVAQLRASESRIDGDAQSIELVTSDELGAILLDLRSEWELVPLTAEIVTDSTNLLLVTVLGCGEPIAAPPVRRKRRPPWLAELDLGDPLRRGARLGGAGLPFGPLGGAGHASDSDASLELAGVAENDSVVHDGADVAEDELVESDKEGDAPVPAAPPTVADAARAAEIGAEGYVYATVPPWSHTIPLGRLTTFPDSLPMEGRSVSCRCYMHLACSIVRMRAAYTDEALLRWLFEGEPLEAGTSMRERRAARGEHMGKLRHVA